MNDSGNIKGIVYYRDFVGIIAFLNLLNITKEMNTSLRVFMNAIILFRNDSHNVFKRVI
jgi:hypothetical protein